MSVIAVKTALEVAVAAITPSIETAWENADFQPTVGTAYQQVHILFGMPDNIEFGPLFRQVGVMQISLFYPLKTGTLAAQTRAELIRSTFKRGNSYSDSGITVTINKTPNIKAGIRDDDRWMIPVDIEFFAHIEE